MIIKVDYREKELINTINSLNTSRYNISKDINIVNENLPIGDIIICDNNDKEYIIFERKTLKDLSSSIKDGRYNEQSFRLNNSNVHNHNIIYIIEGDIEYYYNVTNKNNKYLSINTLFSSMVSIMYYKGFSLYRSKHIQETADIIISFADKLYREMKNRQAFYKNIEDKELTESQDKTQKETDIEIEEKQKSSLTNIDKNDKGDKEYINVIKKNKKENITIDNIGEIMLMQIQNISSQTAIAIMKRFKTLNNLIDNLERNVDISDIYVGNRRISKTSISNIYKYLLQKDTTILINT
jgi:ERCC4-type nuclease